MGLITIILEGSFGGRRATTFSAMQDGHASAVGRAIKYLAEAELPEAIARDHRLHEEGSEPADGFASKGKLITKRRPEIPTMNDEPDTAPSHGALLG